MHSPGVKQRILYLCTGNSCRSQMAEGWTRHLKADLFEAHSAGTHPKGLDPRAIAVMKEVGIDISGGRSKHPDDLKDIAFDYVITVCGNANESCPVLPGNVRRVHAGFEDPQELARHAKTEEEALACYRRVRDEIRQFVEALPQSLVSREEVPAS